MNNPVRTLTNVFKAFSIFILLVFLITNIGFSQNAKYEQLALRNNFPRLYFSTFTLPGEDANTLQLTTTFRLNNNFMSFRKVDNPAKDRNFVSNAALNIEVFKSPKKDLKPDDQVKVSGLASMGRASWQDTAYAATYEQTQSDKQYINGRLQVKVQPGFYTYLLQLALNDESKKRNSRTRNIHVMPYNEQRNGDVLLADKVDNIGSPTRLSLINMGENVIYGKDFYALIHLPDYKPGSDYMLSINRIKPDRKDTMQIKQMLQQPLKAEQIHSGILPVLDASRNEVALRLEKSKNGYTYALVPIPNSSFPDAVYKLTVKTDGQTRPVAQRVFHSYWADIPTSLLSLDVSIDMLDLIADKATIKSIDSGSDVEREKKFRAFWEKKDPTPGTEYNELEAEYYRRIDYAYDHFTSDNQSGYKSDRGKIYITQGPPDDIKRTFPTKGPTTEIWTYGTKKYVFKATTGFGDFVLVSK